MPNPKGMRDIPPEIAILRKKVFSKLEKVFTRFGFDPIETPIVELWSTLRGKYGEETENKLIYAFSDRWGGKELALRYDLTVPLARFMSETQMPLPFKRYAIGRVYRHEEPQKGRYREFYQCDADIVGSTEPSADAEILMLIGNVMKEFKFPGYAVQVNDRRLLSGIFEKGLGINKKILEVYRAIDKLDKQGWGKVKDELKQFVPVNQVNKIKDVIDIQGGPFDVIEEVESNFGKIPEVKTAIKDLREIFELIGNKVITRLNLSMVRGLDYYTGPIFETVIKEPSIGSITGGGRYDTLLGRYGKDLPATGTTIGVERLLDAGLELGIFKLKSTSSDVYVVSLKSKDYAWRVAETLRNKGLAVRIDLMGRNWKKQLSEAEKLGIKKLAIVGPKEEKKGMVTLVNKETNKKRVVKLIEAARELKSL